MEGRYRVTARANRTGSTTLPRLAKSSTQDAGRFKAKAVNEGLLFITGGRGRDRAKLSDGFGQFLTMCFRDKLAGFWKTCGIGNSLTGLLAREWKDRWRKKP